MDALSHSAVQVEELRTIADTEIFTITTGN